MFREQPRQMAGANAETLREQDYIAIVQGAVIDKLQRALYGRLRPLPGGAKGRSFRAASQAWTKPRNFRRRRGRIEAHILGKWHPRRAHWAAIYARSLDADEKQAVKVGITAQARCIACLKIQHSSIQAKSSPPRNK